MHNTHQYGSITFYACFTPKPVILSRPPWYPKQTGLIPMIPVIFPVFESYIPVIKEIAGFWSVHGYWGSSNWSFKEVWKQNDLFDLMNDPFVFVIIDALFSYYPTGYYYYFWFIIMILIYLYRLCLVDIFDVRRFFMAMKVSVMMSHHHRSDGVSSGIDRDFDWRIRWSSHLWIIRHHLPVGYFYASTNFSDFYDFTPKYIITKLMYVYRWYKLVWSYLIQWKYNIDVRDTAEFHQLYRQNGKLMKPNCILSYPWKSSQLVIFTQLVIFGWWYYSWFEIRSL